MKITILDILKKYKTNIGLNKMSNKLKNIVVFSDDDSETNITIEKKVTINDIPRPKYENENGMEKYTYNILDTILIFEYYPENYRTMNVLFLTPSNMEVGPEYYATGWNYDGTTILF